MNIDVIVLIGAVGTVCAIVFGYLGYSSGMKKEFQNDGKESGELKADTEYIRRRIDDILLEQRDTNKTLNVHAERLTRVEESAKSAHHRIDEIKGVI